MSNRRTTYRITKADALARERDAGRREGLREALEIVLAWAQATDRELYGCATAIEKRLKELEK